MARRSCGSALALVALTASACCARRAAPPAVPQRPAGFVSLSDVDPSVQLDIRYFSANNFVGRPIDGYERPLCVLTTQAAAAVARAQASARTRGLCLKVYDCYRPQRAVADFVRWAKDEGTAMQRRFYPAVPKSELFARGYIAERSGHSRGSTLDLTLIPCDSRPPPVAGDPASYDCRAMPARRYPDNSVDMGTGFDCFDELAHTDNPRIDAVGRHNRDELRAIMRGAGFVNYPKEWWHYTLANEPFPDTYFDFVVR